MRHPSDAITGAGAGALTGAGADTGGNAITDAERVSAAPAPRPAAAPGKGDTTPVQVLAHPQLCPQGLSFEARQGRKLVDELLAHGVAIEHACEKVCACATCHVHLREGAEFVAAADEEEEDQLDDAWGLDAQSRLACCVKVKGPGLVVELPKYSKNHAREK